MYFLCVVIKNIEYMDVKERKAKEYADCIPYYQDRRIHAAEDFIAGWEAAVEYLMSEKETEAVDEDAGV